MGVGGGGGGGGGERERYDNPPRLKHAKFYRGTNCSYNIRQLC